MSIKVTFSQKHKKIAGSAFKVREYLDSAQESGILIYFSETECRFGPEEIYIIFDNNDFKAIHSFVSLNIGLDIEGWKLISREVIKDCEIK
jgi:hypothetical protein